MKKLFLFVLLFTIGVNQLIAQNLPHDFGQVTEDELKMPYYDKDSLSEALFLYDIGQSSFSFEDGPMRVIFERRIKIKIFSKAGFKYSKIEIPFYEQDGKEEEFIELEGNTYNFENGKIRITPLDSKNIFVEKKDNDLRYKKFAMPDIKEGSIIEIRFKISSPYFFYFRRWDFQKPIPVVYSEYTTKMIPLFSYKYVLQGTNKLTDFKQFLDPGHERSFNEIFWRDQVYVFIKKDIPAFKDESFITSINDNIIRLDFQLANYINSFGVKVEIMTTWPNMIKKLLDSESIGGYLKDCQDQAEKIVDTMNIESKPTIEKAEKIERFVKDNLKWDGSNTKFSSGKIKEVFKSRQGNSADINLFLIGMLRAKGIEANPLLISTRGYGKIKVDYPFENSFNYLLVDAVIDGQHIILDATDPLSGFGMIPTRCLNDVGLVLKKGDEPEWINFSSPIISSIYYTFDFSPTIASDALTGKFKILSSGYDALNYRRKYIKSTSEFKAEALSDNLTLVDSIQVDFLRLIDKPFSIKFNANSEIEIVDGKMLIAPFAGYCIIENPFKYNTRTYPIDMVYKKKRNYTSTIHIPEGYQLFSKPENFSLDNDDVKISLMAVCINENLVKVVGSYEFKKNVYDASLYLDLKNYFKILIDKFNTKVILVKK